MAATYYSPQSLAACSRSDSYLAQPHTLASTTASNAAGAPNLMLTGTSCTLSIGASLVLYRYEIIKRGRPGANFIYFGNLRPNL